LGQNNYSNFTHIDESDDCEIYIQIYYQLLLYFLYIQKRKSDTVLDTRKRKRKKRHVINEFSIHTLGGTTRLQMAKRYAEHSTKWKFSI